MAYKLFSDKANKFNCNIQVEGTSFANSKVRMILETSELNYMFDGVIHETGVCDISIPKTKNFLPEGTKGNMRLEVIADDVFFQPWSSDFLVATEKKVAVVVQEQQEDEKPKVRVEVFQQPEEKKIVKESPKPVVKEVEPVIEEKVIEKPKIKESVTKKPVKKERTLKFTQEQILDLMKKGLI
jgi:hypothetical protein